MLYLPITEATLQALTAPQAQPSRVIHGLSLAELAALVLVQHLESLISSTPSTAVLLRQAEQILANFIANFGALALPDVQSSVAAAFNSAACQCGWLLLSERALQCLDAEQVAAQAYLKWENQWLWDWSFKDKLQPGFIQSRLMQRTQPAITRVSTEEERILSIIRADLSESVDVQGYAGSGKTWVISQLVEALDKSKTLFMAETWTQVQALTARIPDARGETFANLARTFFQNHPQSPIQKIKGRYGSEYLISNTQLANYLECHELGNYPRAILAKCAWRIVRHFCFSHDPVISLTHVAIYFRTPLYQPVMLQLAQNLWDMICIPNGKSIPIRDYHFIKAYALTGIGISAEIEAVVVDETHHLPDVIKQILTQSPQPVFTFGDCYQALQRTPQLPIDALPSRQYQLAQSLRVGANLETLYNQLLTHHPIAPELDFVGNKTQATRLIHYGKFELPNDYCAILGKSTWSIFCIAHELQKRRANYYLVSRVKADLTRLLDGAISFYAKNTKPGHYEFVNANSWEEFISKNKTREPTLIWADRVLRSGFTHQDLASLLHNAASKPQQAYVLGRVMDCRNLEFDRVLLLNDVIDNSGIVNDDYSSVVSHLYTGISRAKHELYLPGLIQEWIDHT